MEQIDKKLSAKVILYKAFKTFIVHILASQALLAEISIYALKTALIVSDKSVQIPVLQ